MTFLGPIWSTKSQHQHNPIPNNLKSCILKYKASTAACTGWDACGQVSCEEQYVCSTCGQASPSLAADTFWTMHDRATDSNNLQHQGHVLLHTHLPQAITSYSSYCADSIGKTEGCPATPASCLHLPPFTSFCPFASPVFYVLLAWPQHLLCKNQFTTLYMHFQHTYNKKYQYWNSYISRL